MLVGVVSRVASGGNVGVAVSASGTVYFADNTLNLIMMISPAGTIVVCFFKKVLLNSYS